MIRSLATQRNFITRGFGNFVARAPVFDSGASQGNPAINDQVNVLKDFDSKQLYEKDQGVGALVDEVNPKPTTTLFYGKDRPPVTVFHDLVDKTHNTAL